MPPHLAVKLQEANLLIQFACDIIQSAAHCDCKKMAVLLE